MNRFKRKEYYLPIVVCLVFVSRVSHVDRPEQAPGFRFLFTVSATSALSTQQHFRQLIFSILHYSAVQFKPCHYSALVLVPRGFPPLCYRNRPALCIKSCTPPALHFGSRSGAPSCSPCSLSNKIRLRLPLNPRSFYSSLSPH